MQDFSSRRSSATPKPGEIDLEHHNAADTAGLTEKASNVATSKGTKSAFSDTWTLEILCWLLALLCLIIILVVLGVTNDKALRHWGSNLSLNTLINILSQIAQTAVFVPVAASISQMKWIWCTKVRPLRALEDFDKASRGPMDSLRLITKYPKW